MFLIYSSKLIISYRIWLENEHKHPDNYTNIYVALNQNLIEIMHNVNLNMWTWEAPCLGE